MFADIIPYTRLPRKFSIFTYSIKPGLVLKPGMFVRIPFRKKYIWGLVVSIHETNPSTFSNLKSTSDIVHQIKFPSQVPDALMNTAQDNTESAATLLRTFIPEPLHKKTTVKKVTPRVKKFTSFKITTDDIGCIDNVFNNYKGKNSVIFLEYNYKRLYTLYERYCKEAIENNTQLVIIMPTHHELENLYAFLHEKFNPKLLYFHKQSAARGVQWDWFAKLNNHEVSIIIGTNRTLLLPYAKLQYIIMHNYTATEYQEYQQTPRFKTTQLLENIQEYNSSIQIVKTAPVPDLESTYNKEPIVKIPQTPSYVPQIIDMADELPQSTHPYFSLALEEHISELTNTKKKVLILTLKKDALGHILCLDCKTELLCPSCHTHLSAKQGNAYCRNCNWHNNNSSLVCSNCHSYNISMLGFGTKKIAQTITKHYPELTTTIIDSDSTKSEISKQFKQAQIHVASPFIFNTIPWQNYGAYDALFITGIDQILDNASYDSNINCIQFLFLVWQRAVTHGIPLYVQTFKPAHAAMTSFRELHTQPFLDNELTQRMRFQYPPCVHILNLIVKDHNEKLAQAKAQKIYIFFQTNFPEIVISNPVTYGKQRDWFRAGIFCKIPKKHLKLDKIKDFILKNLGENWQIIWDDPNTRPIID